MATKTVLLSCLFFNLLLNSAIAQTVVPPDYKKVVAFIFVQSPTKTLVPNGTGFFVLFSKNGKQAGYLVTAKHVLKNPDGSFLDKIYLRLPKKADSSLLTFPVSLYNKGINKNTFFHADTTVDIAVITEIPNQQIFDFIFLPSASLTTPEDFKNLNIREGNEVFFTGLFAQYYGEKANYPIVRFGRVSLVTDEKVFWNGSLRNLYLLETTTYWGNSGSPVYFAIQRKPAPIPNGIVIGTETVIKLAGIMSGFFGQNVPGGFAETKLVPFQIVNFGISAVTPAYLLWEILNSDQLTINRRF